MHLARPGLADHAHDLARGGAAHDRVVDQHDALALEHLAHRVELELDAEVPDRLLRLDEGAPDVVVADQAPARTGSRSPGRSRARRRCPSRAPGRPRRPRPGCSCASCRPSRLRDWQHAAAEDDRCPGARSRRARRCSARSAPGRNGLSERIPSASTTIISPGSTSRRNSAPIRSKAQVSEATTVRAVRAAEHERPEAPRDRAPRRARRASGRPARRPPHLEERSTRSRPRAARGGCARSRWRMTSVSEVDWKIEPAASSSWRSTPALTRLPLWATAIGPRWQSIRIRLGVRRDGVPGGRVADVADRAVGRAAARGRSSSKTSSTRPIPRSRRRCSPSPASDARRFLAAVLQGVEAEVGEVRRLGVAEDAEDAALVVEVVVLRRPRGRKPTAGSFPAGSPRPMLADPGEAPRPRGRARLRRRSLSRIAATSTGTTCFRRGAALG